MSEGPDKGGPATSLTDAIQRAWQARNSLHGGADREDARQNAYRVFHGFHDGFRGLNIDRLGESCLVSLKHDLTEHLPVIERAVRACHDFKRVVARTHLRHNYDPQPLAVLALVVEVPEAPFPVKDNGMEFLIDLSAEANPGLFLDARPVRRWIKENSRDRRVLNLFSYTGSLGVAAAVGGAKSVTHVDHNAKALAVARSNHELNGCPITDRELLKGDIYYHLPRAARSGISFDAIILDPPPRLSRSKRRRPRGQDYPKLTKLVTPLLAEGGWLLCFFHRYECTREAYEREVLDASDCELDITWRGTSGDDFPERDPDQKLRLTVFERRRQ